MIQVFTDKLHTKKYSDKRQRYKDYFISRSLNHFSGTTKPSIKVKNIYIYYYFILAPDLLIRLVYDFAIAVSSTDIYIYIYI